MPQPSAWIRSESCWLPPSFSRPALATLRILPRSGRIAWVARSRACLAEPPAEVAFDDEEFGASRGVCVQSASLPGRRSLRVAVLRATSFSWRRRSRSSARSITQSSSLSACVRVVGQPMVERIAHRVFDDAGRLDAGQLVLGLALTNSGSRMKTESMAAAEVITSSAVI